MLQTCSTRAAPAAYSNTVRGVTVSQGKGVTTVSGREYAAGGSSFASANTQLIDAILHHPAYYATASLGNMARSFREYRWNSITVHYLGTCSTATNGWTQIVTTPDIQEGAYTYSSNTDLLTRSMSTQGAVLGNLWENISHSVPLRKNWCLTQPFLGEDLRDHCAGETYIYQADASTASTNGICFVDFSISFRDLYYTMHTSIPFTQYTALTCVDSSSTPTSGSIASLTNSTVTTSSNGSIWRMILLADQTTIGTGGTKANALKNYVNGTTTNTLSLVNGYTFYGCVSGSNIELFPTFEAAKVSSTHSFVAYATTLSSASSYTFMMARVSLGIQDAELNV
jgi:hypothetical protein